MKRVITPELLDADAGTGPEIAASLADLRRINRWFGGTRTTCSLLERVARRAQVGQLTVLDVGAASGDVIAATRDRLAGRGLRIFPFALDRSPAHLNGRVPAVAAEALALPFASASFDVVGCSLLAHHFSAQELLAFVSEGLRVCRRAVVINDLRRHPLHLALVYAGYPLYRSRLTRHDGPASVRAAYTEREIVHLLRGSRAARIQVSRHFLFRMGVIAWKH